MGAAEMLRLQAQNILNSCDYAIYSLTECSSSERMVSAVVIVGSTSKVRTASISHVVVLEQTRSGEWQVELNDGFRVALGREDLAARLGRFLAVHREVLVDRAAEVEWIDARYMNGVAVRWRNADQGPAALAWAN